MSNDERITSENPSRLKKLKDEKDKLTERIRLLGSDILDLILSIPTLILKAINFIIGFAYVNSADRTKKNNELKDISEEEYKSDLLYRQAGESEEEHTNRLKLLYEKAWDARKIEIDHYWKRATYFWAFQVASFAGYFAVLNSASFSEGTVISQQGMHFVQCIGLVTAFAWMFINIGSKTWQRHWERHIDMMEDYVTGPLYKTVTTRVSYSVSKINEIVSRFFVFVWMLLFVSFLYENIGWGDEYEINWLSLILSSLTAYFIIAMYLGHGRGRFGKRESEFYRRSINNETSLNEDPI